MALARPSQDEILKRISTRIRNETPLTADLDSSIIGVILKIIAAEMDSLWGYVADIETQSNLTTASGPYLDNFGLLFGVPRKSAQSSTTNGGSRSVRFINNGNASLVVPTGTRVFKTSDPSIAYFTTEGANINAGAFTDVHVTAANIGSVYNVGIGDLNASSLANAAVTVTNILPIINGQLEESDDSYRDRILNELQRRNVLNQTNVVSMLRSIPGVRDVYLLNNRRGAGTFDVVIVPYNSSEISTLVSAAQSMLDENVPVGIIATAKGPIYRQMDIRVDLNFIPSVSDKESIRQSIRAQISSKIDNLVVENGTGIGTLYLSQISAIANYDPNIASAVVQIGIDGTPYSDQGQVKLAIGERLVLRALAVQ